MAPVVVFDIGSTLIHPNPDVLSRIVGIDTAGADTQRLARAFTYALEADQRALPVGDDASRQGQELLRFLDPTCIHDASQSREVWLKISGLGGCGSPLYTELDPDAHNVLTSLRDNGCWLIAASNSDGTLKSELEQFDLGKYFHLVVDSFEIGVNKPDPAFFSHVLSLISLKELEGETWYVGNDVMRDVLGALMAGFRRAVLYDRSDAYPAFTARYRLTKLGDLLSLVYQPSERFR